MGKQTTRENLEAYLHCKTKAHLKLAGQQGIVSDYEALLIARREEVRQQAIAKILAKYPEAEVARDIPLTVAALQSGPPFVLDASLEDDFVSLRFDGLKRVDGPSKLGEFHYIPMLFHEGRKVGKEQRLLLELHGLLLSKTQGKSPAYGILWHGKECTSTKIRLGVGLRKAEQVLRELSEMGDSASPPRLLLNEHCRVCEFRKGCLAKAEEVDSLTLLDRMTPKIMGRYEKKGIFTVTQLSYLIRPRRRKAKRGKGGKGFKLELQAYALRTGKTFLQSAPQLNRSPLEIFMDVESVPDDDFSYLVGLMVLEGEATSYFSFWADSPLDEKGMWDGAFEKIRQYPGAPVYHYGSFDRRAVEKAGKKYQLPCDDIARRMVNVASQVFGKVYFPVRSNGLKEIGTFVGATWASEEASGLKCLCWRNSWERSRSIEWKDRILKYNEEDCIALRLVMDRLSKLGEAAIQADLPGVEFAGKPKRRATGTGLHLHEQFEEIIEFAHFGYRRSRILLRPDGDGEAGAASSPEKRRKHLVFRRIAPSRANKVVKVRRRRKCPRHNVRLTKSDEVAEKIIADLVFTKNGCRKTFVKYVGAKAYCKTCGCLYLPPAIFQICKSAFGFGFQAWVAYQRVALRQPYDAITQMMEDMFEEKITTSAAANFVRIVANRYGRAESNLLRQMLNSPFIHVDDTRINIQGENNYVWVFTDGVHVIFRMTATREANVVHELLKGYKGVMISDFYPGFDSVDCRQQKCLIHLIRDINDELWDNPFDSQLERFAASVRDLLVPILQDVQRYGLKTRHLHKHKVRVDRFYRDEIETGPTLSEVTRRFKDRFQRYRESMFLFLEEDSIPWNNNTGERALRHLAVQRKISGFFFKSFASRYLILLGIAQTCKFQGKSFLKFLLSGEMDVDHFRPVRRRRTTRPLLKPPVEPQEGESQPTPSVDHAGDA
jgi:predicted RecB family nuclease